MPRPAGVVRSTASFRETKPTPRCSSSCKRCQQVRHRAAPAVQSPDQHHVNLAAARRLQQALPQLVLRCAGTDLFHLQGYCPAPPGGVSWQGANRT
jgi:hypothetical protein